MDTETAKEIITYVVTETKPRWQLFDEHWKDIDQNFIWRGYEQGGFETQKFTKILKQYGAFSISKLGSVLDSYEGDKKYKRAFAGSLDAPFYIEMKAGKYGITGKIFAQSIEEFSGMAGAWFWSKLWQMLVCCSHLTSNYNGSYAQFLKSKYAQHKNLATISDTELLSISPDEWETFKRVVRPWNELYGIGENVFDFIVGDIMEAGFVSNSYKLDSANIYFWTITGMSKMVDSITRENAVVFLKKLDMPFTLREMNKGFYTYCSVTESEHYGFCREQKKCLDCGVNNFCEKNFEII